MFRPFFPENPKDAIYGVDYLTVSFSKFMAMSEDLRLLLLRIDQSF